jgi:hypothetical protein
MPWQRKNRGVAASRATPNYCVALDLMTGAPASVDVKQRKELEL